MTRKRVLKCLDSSPSYPEVSYHLCHVCAVHSDFMYSVHPLEIYCRYAIICFSLGTQIVCSVPLVQQGELYNIASLSALKFCSSVTVHLWIKGVKYLSFILSHFGEGFLRETEQNKKFKTDNVLFYIAANYILSPGWVVSNINVFLWAPCFS